MTRDTFDMFAPPDRGRFGDNEQARPGRGPRVTGSSGVHELAVALHHETQQGDLDRGAVLVSKDGEETSAQWIPKSRLQKFERRHSFLTGHKRNGQSIRLPCAVVTLPEALAVEKGLL